jgi:hypothetical protein
MERIRVDEDVFGLDVSMRDLYRLMQTCTNNRNELLEDMFGLG